MAERDSDDPLFKRLEQQMSVEAQLYEKIERYRRFLTEHGISLDIEAALDMPERVVIANLNIVSIGLAARHSLIAQVGESAPDKAAEFLKSTRQEIIRNLWLEGLWQEPWISLVNQEIPGEGPTNADFEMFIQEAGDKVQQKLEIITYREQMFDQLMERLIGAGYAPEERDAIVLHQLIVMIYRAGLSGNDKLAVGAASRDLLVNASNPQHPVWEQIMQEFFGP